MIDPEPSASRAAYDRAISLSLSDEQLTRPAHCDSMLSAEGTAARLRTVQRVVILADHLDRDETTQKLAQRLGYTLSTVEVQMKRAPDPEVPARTGKKIGFV